MKTMHLYPDPIEGKGALVKRSCRIERYDGQRFLGSNTLWYEFPEIEHLPAEADAESFLIANLMQAMEEGRQLIVHGRVSGELLANLTEYRDAWHCWLPHELEAIDFEAETITEEVERKPGAVCAFSGGLDATFSVWRHFQHRNGYRSQSIKLCTLVHGFDIPLQDEKAFVNAYNYANNTLKSINMPLLAIRTNFRQVVRTNWEHVFAAALVAAFQNFKEIAGTCIIGSSRPYVRLIFPYGSNAVTDPLLSANQFKVLHDGATHSRTQKAAAVADWEVGFHSLRVCWQGLLKDRNCGKCEKCLRTMLNFRANDLPIPRSFPQQEVDVNLIRKVKWSNVSLQGEWKQIYETALRNNVQDDWVLVLGSKLKRRELMDAILPHGSAQREFIKKLVGKKQKLKPSKPKVEAFRVPALEQTK